MSSHSLDKHNEYSSKFITMNQQKIDINLRSNEHMYPRQIEESSLNEVSNRKLNGNFKGPKF